MKPTKNFKMASTTKTMLAAIVDTNARNAFKANMIQAQLASEIKPAKEKK